MNMEYEFYSKILFDPLSKGDSNPFFSFYRRKSGTSRTSNIAVFENKFCLETADIFNTFFRAFFSKPAYIPRSFDGVHQKQIQVSQEGVLEMLKKTENRKSPRARWPELKKILV